MERKQRIKIGKDESADTHADTLPVVSTEPGNDGTETVKEGIKFLHRLTGEKLRSGDCEVIFHQDAYHKIVRHLSNDMSREHGGLLLGYEDATDPNKKFVWVIDALPARHEKGTISRLMFTHDTWADFDDQTEHLRQQGNNIKRLGWYHSHPNFGIFLSSYDLDVCSSFTGQMQVALVYDPIRQEGGFFVNGVEGYDPHRPQGFWELGDLHSPTVVTWKNVRSNSLLKLPVLSDIETSRARQVSIAAETSKISIGKNSSVPETTEPPLPPEPTEPPRLETVEPNDALPPNPETVPIDVAPPQSQAPPQPEATFIGTAIGTVIAAVISPIIGLKRRIDNAKHGRSGILILGIVIFGALLTVFVVKKSRNGLSSREQVQTTPQQEQAPSPQETASPEMEVISNPDPANDTDSDPASDTGALKANNNSTQPSRTANNPKALLTAGKTQPPAGSNPNNRPAQSPTPEKGKAAASNQTPAPTTNTEPEVPANKPAPKETGPKTTDTVPPI